MVTSQWWLPSQAELGSLLQCHASQNVTQEICIVKEINVLFQKQNLMCLSLLTSTKTVYV